MMIPNKNLSNEKKYTRYIKTAEKMKLTKQHTKKIAFINTRYINKTLH